MDPVHHSWEAINMAADALVSGNMEDDGNSFSFSSSSSSGNSNSNNNSNSDSDSHGSQPDKPERHVHWSQSVDDHEDASGFNAEEGLPLFAPPSASNANVSRAWANKRSASSSRRLWVWSKLRARLTMAMLFLLLPAALYLTFLWLREQDLNAKWRPDRESLLFSRKPLPAPLERTWISSYRLPLRTEGRSIVDADGRRFKLSSINWYGASDELFVPGGLDVQHRSVIAETIKKMGFNSVRLPYADELVMKNPVIEPGLVLANPDLQGLRAMDVLEAVTTALTDAGIAVIVNNHITRATWCCGADPCDAGWANDHLGPLCAVKQTEEEWIQHWEEVMGRFVHNPLVIGADLRNEVRGLWGTMPWSKWAAAAEKCGNRLLKMKPDWLIIVEGTESANDVSGALDRPVRLDVDNRLVYSAHGYKWSGWGSWQGRFAQRSYKSFVKTMRRNWAYLLEVDIAPVWFGELGAPSNPSVGDVHYWSNLMRYLKSIDADFGYWALNPRKPKDNEKESYSLVQDDWVTPVLDYRMKDLQELIRQ